MPISAMAKTGTSSATLRPPIVMTGVSSSMTPRGLLQEHARHRRHARQSLDRRYRGLCVRRRRNPGRAANRAHAGVDRAVDVAALVVAHHHRALRGHFEARGDFEEGFAIGLAIAAAVLGGEDDGVDESTDAERRDLPRLHEWAAVRENAQ